MAWDLCAWLSIYLVWDSSKAHPYRGEFVAASVVGEVTVSLAAHGWPHTDAGREARSEEAGVRFDGRSVVRLLVNGHSHTLRLEPRVTLVDALRDRLGLTGTKKGCDRGECGACTVHVDGRPVLACLTLAVMVDGAEITTIEGLARDGTLHPVQEAFLCCDAFQCGFCTPGQVMSAVACIGQGHADSVAEIKEWMSGNLCRCGSYPHIVAAIMRVMASGRDRWVASR